MITNSKQFLAALALVALGSTVAVAQTDFGSPIGSGGGLGGSVAPLGVPNAENMPGGASRALSGPAAAGLATARASLMNAGTGGVTVTNPAGGTVTVPQAAARGLGAVLGGNPTPAQVSAFTSALTGVPAGSSTALTNALRAFGANANFNTLTAAVRAYNAAIDALPAGATPPPALLAVRNALAAASRR
ncbi:MAG: hypothetical protein WD771_06605 [Gemmatimonadaceae bacterium]